jgi:hypothetical protein
MMGQELGDVAYPDDFVTGLAWIWGEGFMSPGGADFTAQRLKSSSMKEVVCAHGICGEGNVLTLNV